MKKTFSLRSPRLEKTNVSKTAQGGKKKPLRFESLEDRALLSVSGAYEGTVEARTTETVPEPTLALDSIFADADDETDEFRTL